MLHDSLIHLRRKEVSPDAADLARELGREIEGEVRFDDGARALYATDASNYRQVPIGVVLPRSIEDVLRTVAVARRFGAPILARGGGTSLAGQCCNVAVVIDMSKYMNNVLDIDPAARTARVQPGTILDDLRGAAERHHLTFGPDPATHAWCTLGGMLGNNSCGVHALMAGKTADNTIELDVVTYDGARMTVGRTPPDDLERACAEPSRRGQIYRDLKALRDRVAPLVRERYPDIPRRVSGYNLDQLLPENDFHVARALVGTESTCAVVLEAKLRLVHSPPSRCLAVLGYPDVYSACDHILEVLESKPIGCEGLDNYLIDFMRRKGLHAEDVALLPEGSGWLVVEMGGDTPDEAAGKAHALMDRLRGEPGAPKVKLITDRDCQDRIWKVRESGLGATAHVPGEPPAWPGWEDSAVAPEKLGRYLRDLRALYDEHGYRCALYGHFGQGCVHCRVTFDLFTAPGVAKFRSFLERAADLVVRYGGSLSGEHGDGQGRAELLTRMFGRELVTAFGEFKRVWDPDGKMNPGKIVMPNRLDHDLRLGPSYRPPSVSTHFHFGGDEGSFSRATLRCVGVGECRRLDKATMCPSFRVTREEMHTTRGRARLLFEMMQGEELSKGFHEEAVKEALDLCLACKGCKGDCPVNVDMATYKAEFLAHYYEHRARPMAAYSMGLIRRWAGLAAHVPRLANFVTQGKILGGVAKALGGIAGERKLPAFARETFKRWFFGHHVPPRREGEPVVLWADTFNDHFTPEIAKAAVHVLEAAGYRVMVPEEDVCCGRPLYDWGMLDEARRTLQKTLFALRPAIEAGLPVVVLEPSCAAVFRDEMPDLLPQDEDARRLHKQVVVLAELLDRRATGFDLPRMAAKVIVQKHCHQAAVIGMEHDRSVLSKMGVDLELLDAGCCGMAGSFGFERGRRHQVSVAIGEQGVLPAVRAAAEETLILADGFSCREQILQGTGRRPIHLAQAIWKALGEPVDGRRGAEEEA